MATRPPHRVEIHSGPDNKGRYGFMVFWMADYPPNCALERDFDGSWHERGQVFFSRPEQGSRIQSLVAKEANEQARKRQMS